VTGKPQKSPRLLGKPGCRSFASGCVEYAGWNFKIIENAVSPLAHHEAPGGSSRRLIFHNFNRKLGIASQITVLIDDDPMLSAPEILNREFLEIRCKILELAAAFDRLERSEGSVSSDPRLAKLREALNTILEHPSDRAEQVQMIFSREYDDDWQAKFKVAPR
jgi:hypothetical protein